MDRKSKQKIVYILWLVTTVIVVIIFFFCKIDNQNKIHEEQKRELIIIYPEIEIQLEDNFTYYKTQIVRSELIIMLAVLSLMMILTVGFALIGKHEKRSYMKELNNEIDLLYEQLLRFHKGDFEIIRSHVDSRATGNIDRVYDEVRELSYYFSDLKERLIEEENSTKTLITDISHQLKTPLASIRMCHELARSTELSEYERKEFQTKEAQEIMKMEMLLDELVKLSRLENNMIQIKPKKESLKQTISEAVSQIFMKAHAKNIEICVDMEKDIVVFHDKKWTVEAFSNIIENAVKYSPATTAIRIRVNYLSNSVLIEIEDEGMGIMEDELHQIFKRFYRGSKAKELAKEGAGVGLYLARNIIEQQGGTIIAKKNSDIGTIFKIMLPI